MGYDFIPNNDIETFYLGAFSFPVVLEICNYLFPCIHEKGQWFCVFGADERMPKGDKYPRILSNDNFPVTEEEAKIMARMCKNFVVIQRSLNDTHKVDDMRSKSTFTRNDVLSALMKGMTGMTGSNLNDPFPVKIREDFVDKIEKFAEWMEISGGFEKG